VPPAGAAPEGDGGPPSPMDTSGGGGGNIGVGQAPAPGMDGFSGAPAGASGPAPMGPMQ